MLLKRLRWRRVRAGFYAAGCWQVKRLDYHRPLWKLFKVTGPWTAKDGLPTEDLGVFDTAGNAKGNAEDLTAERGG